MWTLCGHNNVVDILIIFYYLKFYVGNTETPYYITVQMDKKESGVGHIDLSIELV